MTSLVCRKAIEEHGACQDEWELEQLVSVLLANCALRLVVEIGCDRGGTLWLWRQLGAEVAAVTLHTRTDGVFDDHGAHVITGDSRAIATRSKLWQHLHNRAPDMVFVDGGHDAATAHSDIQLGLELAPAGLVVVHDIYGHLYQEGCRVDLAWDIATTGRPNIMIVREPGRTPGVGVLFPRR